MTGTATSAIIAHTVNVVDKMPANNYQNARRLEFFRVGFDSRWNSSLLFSGNLVHHMTFGSWAITAV